MDERLCWKGTNELVILLVVYAGYIYIIRKKIIPYGNSLGVFSPTNLLCVTIIQIAPPPPPQRMITRLSASITFKIMNQYEYALGF